MRDEPIMQALDSGALLRFVYTCPLGMVLTDAQGTINILNGKATSLLAPCCPDGALDNLFAFVARWDEEAEAALRRLVGTTRAQALVHRLRVAAIAGPETWLELYALLFDQGLSVTCQDVTEVVIQQRELLELATGEAQQRGRAELAVGILHDMGNALTGISGQSVAIRALLEQEDISHNLERLAVYLGDHQAALDSALGSGKGESVANLLRAMHRAHAELRTELFEALQALSTCMSHAHELLWINRTYARSASAPESVELRSIIRDVRDMTRTGLRTRQGTLDIHLPAALPRIAVDRSKLIQILLSLIRNGMEAWDSAPAEPLRIEVQIRSDLSGLIVDVRDNGRGFAPERAETSFARDAGARARDSGSDLHDCRKIAESMGGRLALSSPGPGKGTLATLHLPPESLRYETDT